MKRKLILLAAFLSFVVLFFSKLSFAQIFIEEGKVEIELEPGKSVMRELNLHNTTDKTVTMKVYWEDFEYQPPFKGGKKFLPAGTSNYSCSKWVKYSPFELEFPPYGKKKVSYVINTPEDVRGGYYGVLFVENAFPQGQTMKGINIVSRVGSLFFLETVNKTISSQFDGYMIADNALNSKLTNTGDVILIPDGVYYILDSQGIVADRGTIPKVYLPPGKTADYGFEFSDDLSLGKYTIVITIELPSGDVMVKEIDFQKASSSSYRIENIRD